MLTRDLFAVANLVIIARYGVLLVYFFFAHQHKAAGVKTNY